MFTAWLFWVLYVVESVFDARHDVSFGMNLFSFRDNPFKVLD